MRLAPDHGSARAPAALRLAYTPGMRVNRILLRMVPTAVLALAGCGQTGALYLPDAGVETPVEIRPPSAPAQEPASAPTPDDKEKKTDEPQGL